jgi:transposase
VVSDELEDLKRRLVVGHKRDGRSVYDEAAKSELVALCLRSDVSVARVARDCGVNANQVSRWLREHHQGGRRPAAGGRVPAPAAAAAFMAVPVVRSPSMPAGLADGGPATLEMQARLPNGVALDLRGLQTRHVGAVIEALGSLRCSASTTP